MKPNNLPKMFLAICELSAVLLRGMKWAVLENHPL